MPLIIAFQSTCSRRARQIEQERLIERNRFNPRAREEHDLRDDTYQSNIAGFNPRAREEHDAMPRIFASSALWFQSTCSRRARPQARQFLGVLFGFNPRAREEHDLLLPFHHRPMAGFNPRAREEHDLPVRWLRSLLYVSIHVLAKSTTPTGAGKSATLVFQSTCSRRARRCRPKKRRHSTCFNPRAREEHDQPS